MKAAIAKVHRVANDPVARQYGSTRFSHKEVVALSMALHAHAATAAEGASDAEEADEDHKAVDRWEDER